MNPETMAYLRRPGVAMAGGAGLGALLGAGIGAATANPDLEGGGTRGQHALAGAAAGAGAGLVAGAGTANWRTKAAPKSNPAAPMPAAPAPHHEAPAPMPTAAETAPAGPRFQLGAGEYDLDPNHAYGMVVNGKPDVVKFIGTHPEVDSVPHFESMTRMAFARPGKPQRPLTFYATPEQVEGDVHKLMPVADLERHMDQALLAGQDHPVTDFAAHGDPAALEPIKSASFQLPELWALALFASRSA